ncbi:NDR1/HIN1-like protein 1 [Impatiens glandulifera]|uniref:NDR1/HIN1-like protein 1 n=1 Tax=Impatiens glandulifera TaxID=253017 RepID=UPI001FB0EF26|nr:NDR1/HIN1-like protein 1 [Impatiens glandulifera]
MSPAVKECIHHHKPRWHKLLRRWSSGLLIFGFIVLVVVLLIWAILHPQKPRFILQDATIFNFNISAPNLISSNLQITVASQNPNDQIGVFYDKLSAYAVYQNQQITYYSAIPPVYQGHKDNNVWSPFLYGVNVPIAPYNGEALTQDQSDGSVNLMIKLDGHVRWKVGTFTSRRYHIHVRCPATINFGSGASNGVFVVTVVKYQLDRSCSVAV